MLGADVRVRGPVRRQSSLRSMLVRRTVIVPTRDLSGIDPADFEQSARRFDRLSWTILSDSLPGTRAAAPARQASACCEDATLSGCDSVVSMPLPSSTTDRDWSRPGASPATGDPASEQPLPREEMA